MAWHEAAPDRPKFLFKLKLTNLVRSALSGIKESDWQGPAILGACQMPDSFTEVQWTRLPGGETAEKFSERVKKLLGGTVAGVATSATASAAGTGLAPDATNPAPSR